MTEGKKVWDAKEVADYCSINLRLVYKEAKAGNIPHVKCGDRFLFSREQIERWLKGELKPANAVTTVTK